MALATWWTIASLIVSWWVYDASGIMDWSRLAPVVDPTVKRWINVHAGLDSTTSALKRVFPQSRGITLSIYDPVVMTERSIHRARRAQADGPPAIASTATRLEACDAECDVAFLLFAAHEVRAEWLRSRLFAEVYRVLRPGGQLILAEHLRDAPNFIAFGPGAFHFFSSWSWDRLANEQAFVRVLSERMTPFVRLWVWRKPS
jgi:SAM-dependent methyltransferase